MKLKLILLKNRSDIALFAMAAVLATIFSFLLFTKTLSNITSIFQVSLAFIVALGIFAIAIGIRVVLNLEKILPKYQESYSTLMKARQNPDKLTIERRGREEVKKVDSKEFCDVLCREHFRRILRSWDSPDTIATFHALESLQALSKDWLDNDFMVTLADEVFQNDLLVKQLNRRYSKDKGNWYANDKDTSPYLEAAYAVFRMTKNFLEVKSIEPTRENIAKILGNKRIEIFEKRLIEESFDPTTGGFKDTDESKPTVPTTGLVVRICSIICNNGNHVGESSIEHRMDTMFKFQKNKTPSSFIIECFKEKDQVAGFSEIIDSEEIYMCVNYFAANTLHILGHYDFLEENQKKKAISFLDLCQIPPDQNNSDRTSIGFSASLKYKRSDLMHTYYALRYAQILSSSFLEQKPKLFFKQLTNFLKSCKSNGGYGFRENWAPNVYATCLARNLSSLIKSYHRDIDTYFDPLESLHFFLSCYSGIDLEFAGYPYEYRDETRHTD